MSGGIPDESVAPVQLPDRVSAALGVPSLDVADNARRYALRQRIAHTEELEVWHAIDRRVGRDVVLKLCTSDQPDAREKFLRETCIQAQLEHPNIVPIYDFGLGADNREFSTAQRVSGITLRSVLDGLVRGDVRLAKKFAHNRLLGIFHQLCLVSDFMHMRGVIHRNLSPDNAVIGDFGELYVMGWGFAAIVNHESTSQNELRGEPRRAAVEDRFVGTPGYASPEQLANAGDIDRRTDVYALGAILFEILTHRRLHQGASLEELCRSTTLGADARPTARSPALQVPAELEQACVKATALEKAARYATVRELAEIVERALEKDRDAENRRSLARSHAELAESLAVHALVSKTDSSEHRRRALGEVGRALALDPESSGARRALTTLLTEPPLEVPPEARQALQAEEADRARSVGRFGAGVYLSFLLAVSTALLFGVTSFLAFGLLISALVGAVIACVVVARAERPRPVRRLVTLATSSLAIGLASALYGSLILVPALAVANTLGLSGGMDRRLRPVVLLFGCASVAVPFALERLGVVGRSYVFEHDLIRVLPVMTVLPELPVRTALFLVGIVTICLPTLLVWRNTAERETLRERLYQQTWQLARLLPNEARRKLFADPDSPSSAAANRRRA